MIPRRRLRPPQGRSPWTARPRAVIPDDASAVLRRRRASRSLLSPDAMPLSQDEQDAATALPDHRRPSRGRARRGVVRIGEWCRENGWHADRAGRCADRRFRHQDRRLAGLRGRGVHAERHDGPADRAAHRRRARGYAARCDIRPRISNCTSCAPTRACTSTPCSSARASDRCCRRPESVPGTVGGRWSSSRAGNRRTTSGLG